MRICKKRKETPLICTLSVRFRAKEKGSHVPETLVDSGF